jgi:hypothetical protein
MKEHSCAPCVYALSLEPAIVIPYLQGGSSFCRLYPQFLCHPMLLCNMVSVRATYADALHSSGALAKGDLKST